MKRKNPDTSNEAYHSLSADAIRDIYKKILGSLLVIKEGTFEEIANHLHIDGSIIWKRLSEMNDLGMIHRPGNKRKLSSGRQGYTWAAGKAVTALEKPARKKRVNTTQKITNDITGGLFS